jgi:hypothetical protein
MVISINPNRINISSGGTGRASERKRQNLGSPDGFYTVPVRSDVNYIPAHDSLMTLINSAIEALKHGVYWDRGTILNLLV